MTTAVYNSNARVLKKSLPAYFVRAIKMHELRYGVRPTKQYLWATLGKDHGYRSDAYVNQAMTKAFNECDTFMHPLDKSLTTKCNELISCGIQSISDQARQIHEDIVKHYENTHYSFRYHMFGNF
jgi:hypothetical protein